MYPRVERGGHGAAANAAEKMRFAGNLSRNYRPFGIFDRATAAPLQFAAHGGLIFSRRSCKSIFIPSYSSREFYFRATSRIICARFDCLYRIAVITIYRYEAASVTIECCCRNVECIENPIKSKTSMHQFNRNTRKRDCLFDYSSNSISGPGQRMLSRPGHYRSNWSRFGGNASARARARAKIKNARVRL